MPAPYNETYLQALHVCGAAAMVRTAAAHDIRFTPQDIAEQLQYAVRPFYRRRHRQQTAAENIITIQREAAEHTEAEYAVGRKFAAWLEGLDSKQRENLRLRPGDVIDDYYLTPMQVVMHDETAGDSTFDLGQHFAFLEPSLSFGQKLSTLVPAHIWSFLTEKQAYWNTQGIENAGILTKFLEQQFTYIEVDLAAAEQEPEIERLLKLHPESAVQLEAAERIRLRRPRTTPTAILKHIHEISQTQNKLHTTWLSEFVSDGVEPVMRESDLAAIERKRLEARVRIHQQAYAHNFETFQRNVLLLAADERARVAGELEEALCGIAYWSHTAHGIEVTLPSEQAASEREALILHAQTANEYLDQDLGVNLALEYMERDLATQHTESIVSALRFTGGIIAGGEVLHLLAEQFPQLAGALTTLIFVLGLLEDPISELGEARSQHRLGYPWKEIASRYALIGPVAIGCVAAGFTIEGVESHAGPVAASLLYATASCLTSMVTQYKNFTTASESYRNQVADLKVCGHIELGIEGRRAVHQAILAGDGDPDATYHHIQQVVEQELIRQNIDPETISDELQYVYEAIEMALVKDRLGQALDHVHVRAASALRVAYAEVLGNNTARTGKLGAIVLMYLAASLFPGAILGVAPLTTAFSGGEVIGGTAGDQMNKYTDRVRRWRRIRKATGKAQLTTAPA